MQSNPQFFFFQILSFKMHILHNFVLFFLKTPLLLQSLQGAGRGAEISNGAQELFFTFHPAQPWLHVAVRGAGKCTCESLTCGKLSLDNTACILSLVC